MPHKSMPKLMVSRNFLLPLRELPRFLLGTQRDLFHCIDEIRLCNGLSAALCSKNSSFIRDVLQIRTC